MTQHPKPRDVLVNSLTFHFFGYLLLTGILYAILFSPLSWSLIWSAVLTASGVGVAGYFTWRLRRLTPGADRSLDGWRGVPRLLQLPLGVLLIVGAALRCRQMSEGTCHWVFTLLAAEMLANPAHVVSVRETSGSVVALSYLPWIIASVSAAVGACSSPDLTGAMLVVFTVAVILGHGVFGRLLRKAEGEPA